MRERELAQVQRVPSGVMVDAVADARHDGRVDDGAAENSGAKRAMLAADVSHSASCSASTLCTGTRTFGASAGSFSAAQCDAAISSTAGAGAYVAWAASRTAGSNVPAGPNMTGSQCSGGSAITA